VLNRLKIFAERSLHTGEVWILASLPVSRFIVMRQGLQPFQ
jgi:hypothetical protein